MHPCPPPPQVDNPLDAAPFLPQLLPGLEKVSNEVADPECRAVAARAAKELVRVANEGKTGVCIWAAALLVCKRRFGYRILSSSTAGLAAVSAVPVR